MGPGVRVILSIVGVLAFACSSAPADPACPPGLQEWMYSRLDAGVLYETRGCATPAAIDSMMVRCMAGGCGPL